MAEVDKDIRTSIPAPAKRHVGDLAHQLNAITDMTKHGIKICGIQHIIGADVRGYSVGCRPRPHGDFGWYVPPCNKIREGRAKATSTQIYRNLPRPLSESEPGRSRIRRGVNISRRLPVRPERRELSHDEVAVVP